MSIVTIAGDRQAGKTHALLALAAADASAGQRVVWFADTWDYAAYAQRSLLDYLNPDLVQKVRLGRGNRSVATTTGGAVSFLSVLGSGKPLAPDTVVFDALERYRLPDVVAAYPQARIYVAETTGTDAGPVYLAERLLATARDYAEAVTKWPA